MIATSLVPDLQNGTELFRTWHVTYRETIADRARSGPDNSRRVWLARRRFTRDNRSVRIPARPPLLARMFRCRSAWVRRRTMRAWPGQPSKRQSVCKGCAKDEREEMQANLTARFTNPLQAVRRLVGARQLV